MQQKQEKQFQAINVAGYKIELNAEQGQPAMLFDNLGNSITGADYYTKMAQILPEIKTFFLNTSANVLAFYEGNVNEITKLQAEINKPIGNNKIWKYGEADPDGWLYANKSDVTGTRLWMYPESYLTTWSPAIKKTQALQNFHGHKGSKQETAKKLQLAVDNDCYDGGISLPTIEEFPQLLLLIENSKGVRDFNSFKGWSSSEYNEDEALYQCRTAKECYRGNKGLLAHIVCVRRDLPKPKTP